MKVIKINKNFNVYFNIINAQTGVPLATYEEDCSKEELYKEGEESVVNKAVLKMLEDDLCGTHSSPKIKQLKKEMKFKSNTKSVTNRDNKIKIAFLPPALINCDDIWMREILPGRLVNAFFSYSNITPLDQGAEGAALDKIRDSESGIYDERTILEAGKLVSAPYYCYASITRINDNQYQAYFNLVTTKTGKPLAVWHTICSATWIRGLKDYSFNVIDLAVLNIIEDDLNGKYANDATLVLKKKMDKLMKDKFIIECKSKNVEKYTVENIPQPKPKKIPEPVIEPEPEPEPEVIPEAAPVQEKVQPEAPKPAAPKPAAPKQPPKQEPQNDGLVDSALRTINRFTQDLLDRRKK